MAEASQGGLAWLLFMIRVLVPHLLSRSLLMATSFFHSFLRLPPRVASSHVRFDTQSFLFYSPFATSRTIWEGLCFPGAQAWHQRPLTCFRIVFRRAMQRMVTQVDAPEPRKSQYCSVS